MIERTSESSRPSSSLTCAQFLLIQQGFPLGHYQQTWLVETRKMVEWIGHQWKLLHKEKRVLSCLMTQTIRLVWFQQVQLFMRFLKKRHPSFVNVSNDLCLELVSVQYSDQIIKKKINIVGSCSASDTCCFGNPDGQAL